MVVVKINQGTTTWTVPTDFGSLVSIECIGAGGSGAAGRGQASGSGVATGGGGGAYAKSVASDLTGLTFSIGTVFNVQVGLGGPAVTESVTGLIVGNAGTDTWFGNSAPSLTTGVLAKAGGAGQQNSGTTATSGGAAGSSASSVGSTKFAGGAGGAGTSGFGRVGTGGGGAGGTTAAGSNGVASAASNASTAGGAGGTASGGTAGASGGGTGGNGTIFGGSDGAGGGGGGNFAASGTTTAGSGGQWGSGGGACCNGGTSATSGAGKNGILVITYNQLPLGQQFSNLPSYLFPLLPNPDWQQPFKQNLNVVSQPPNIQYYWTNPTLGVLPNRDWQYFLTPPNTLLPRAPNRYIWDRSYPNQDWQQGFSIFRIPPQVIQYTANPNLPQYPQDWQRSFYQPLAGQDKVPGKVYTLNPTLSYIVQDYQKGFYQPLAGQDKLPSRQRDWPNPLFQIRTSDWIQSKNPNLVTVVNNPNVIQLTTIPPGIQSKLSDWQYFLQVPTPAVATTILRNANKYGTPSSDSNSFWINYAIPVGQDVLPFNQHNWTVPKGPDSVLQSFNNYIIPPTTIVVQALPRSINRTPLLLLDYTAALSTVQQRIIPQTVVILPNIGSVYFTPTSGAVVQSWVLNTNVNLFSVPHSSIRTELPVTLTAANVQWISYELPFDYPPVPEILQSFVVPRGPDTPAVIYLPYIQPPTVVNIPNISREMYSNPVLPVLPNKDWINFLTGIPVPIVASGRYITEAETKEAVLEAWHYKEGLETLYRHLAAQRLGKAGGIASGKSRGRR